MVRSACAIFSKEPVVTVGQHRPTPAPHSPSSAPRSPVLRGIRIWYPRASWLQYLPAVYQEDQESASFLSRFLSILQTSFDCFDETIDDIASLFDPLSVPNTSNEVKRRVNNAGIAVPASRWKELNKRAEARLDEMGNRTGVTTHLDDTQDLSDEEWHRMIAVHLNGTFFCTREALKLMSRKNSGVIINMSSVAALRGLDVSPDYSAAKGGILSFTRAVAQEVASRNIRVNAICLALSRHRSMTPSRRS